MIRNPYIDFLNLIPKQSKWIGTVTEKRSDGYVYVKRLNSYSSALLCSSASDVQVGKKVLVQGSNVVSSLADSQTVMTVELE